MTQEELDDILATASPEDSAALLALVAERGLSEITIHKPLETCPSTCIVIEGVCCC